MKTIQKEIKTFKNIYVAVDGKEFENEADCREWENSYKRTLEESWKLIKKIEVCDCNLGIPWSTEDHECYVLQPKDLDEITLLNAYVESVTCGGVSTIMTTEHIGKVICLDFGYDRDWCDVYILENHIKQITDYVADLTKELNGKRED